MHPQQLAQHRRPRSAAGSARSTGPGRPSGCGAGRARGRAAASTRAVEADLGRRPARSSPARASASVDLPDPDSPTRASASPRRISRSTPSTACSRRCSPRSRAGQARADREGHRDVARRQQRLAGTAGRPHGDRAAARALTASRRPDLPRWPRYARSAGRRWPARSGRPAAACRWSGISSAKAHRGWNRQPDGGLTRLGGEPGMGTSDSFTYSKSGAERTSPSVYGCRGSAAPRGPRPARPAARRT